MMAKRPKQTLMDYMVIGISPALIMTLVGSLLFFLLTVFYHGQHETRLTIIFSLFVMAIVLIARISMEEGIEYATLFAIPLAVVTGMAMVRFVRIGGALASYGMVINFGLMALVWWSAHKLTWDCTLIDDNQDSSGEGLLQEMGLASDSLESEQDDASGDLFSEETVRPQDAKPRGNVPVWWQRMIDRRHRPHTPGVWVVYYSIAALVLFGIGQRFIPASDSASRLWAFRLMFVYMFSALGLLLTTSFLGLRRYLRQRHLQMPLDMAGMWLGIGSILILVLLLFCVFLPRPGAELKVSQIPVSFGSPDDDRTHERAWGNDGPQQPDQATRTRNDAQDENPRGGAQSGAATDSSSQQGSSGQSSAQQSPGGSKQAAGKSAAGEQSDSNPQNSSQRAPGDFGKQPSDATGKSKGSASGGQEQRQDRSRQNDLSAAPKPNPQDHTRNNPGDEDPHGRRASGKEPGKPPASQRKTSSRGEAKPESADARQGSRQGKEADRAASGDGATERGEQGAQRQAESKPNQQDMDQRQTNDRGSGGTKMDEERSPSAPNKKPENSRETTNSQSATSSSQAFSVSRALSRVASGFGALLKLLLWAVLMCIVAYFAWKHRDRVLEAVRQLISDLKSLLARLLGGRRNRVDEDVAASQPLETVPQRPFASYADPFASGKAQHYSTEQLVRYSFEALEAWGRNGVVPARRSRLHWNLLVRLLASIRHWACKLRAWPTFIRVLPMGTNVSSRSAAACSRRSGGTCAQRPPYRCPLRIGAKITSANAATGATHGRKIRSYFSPIP